MRRLISLITIAAFLGSLVMPVYADDHHCAGSELIATGRGQPSGHHHDGHHHDGHQHDGHHHDGQHHVEAAAHHNHRLAIAERHGPAPYGATFCCANQRTMPHRDTYVATLAGSSNGVHLLPSPVPAAVHVHVQRNIAPIAEHFKIGASPPFSASIARHTYLAISVLLI